MLLSPGAASTLSQRLHGPAGAPLGEVFSFMSALYFRGKLTYATHFAAPPDPECPIAGAGVFVITPTAGLRTPDTPITAEMLRQFAGVSIEEGNAAYRTPLHRSALRLAGAAGDDCDVVLLGSVASDKYVEILLPVFGDRLVFPSAFVGRGDMSRGGLLLRAAQSGQQLTYVPVAGAVRHGPRPPRLGPAPLRRHGGDAC